jgi:hypothetical protein
MRSNLAIYGIYASLVPPIILYSLVPGLAQKQKRERHVRGYARWCALIIPVAAVRRSGFGWSFLIFVGSFCAIPEWKAAS